VDTYPHAVLGYRAWRIEQRQLWPLFVKDNPWLPGVNSAVCGNGASAFHSAPTKNCGCGFNLYHEFDDAFLQAAQCQGRSDQLLIGVVAGRGAVEIHRDGLRVAEAQILCFLDVLSTDELVISEISEIYQVPVFKRGKDMEDFLTALGEGDTAPKPVAPELRPCLSKREQRAINYKRIINTSYLTTTLALIALAGLQLIAPPLLTLTLTLQETALIMVIIAVASAVSIAVIEHWQQRQ